MSVEEIRRLIEEMNLRVSKDYQKINIEQLSRELREAMQFERQTFQRIDELGKKWSGARPSKLCKNDL